MALSNTVTGQLCKTLALAVEATSPYITEGAEVISTDQLAGKRMGQSIRLVSDSANIEYNADGMVTSFGDAGIDSVYEDIKIADSAAKISKGALDKACNLGNYDQFIAKTAVEISNKMAEKTALRDIGKGSAVKIATDAAGVIAAMVPCQKWGQNLFAYAGWNALGQILSTSKLNCPVMMNDSYANSTQYAVGPAKMRGIEFPVMNRLKETSITTIALAAGTGAVTVAGTITAGEVAKLTGKDIWVYFPTTDDDDAVVIGDKSLYSSAISATAPDKPSANESYNVIIVRAQGANAVCDASSLIEAKDEVQSAGTLSIAITNVKNSERGFDTYLDCPVAAGLGLVDKAEVILLKA